MDEEGGPSATCEISTWDPDPRMELSFDSDAAYVCLIVLVLGRGCFALRHVLTPFSPPSLPFPSLLSVLKIILKVRAAAPRPSPPPELRPPRLILTLTLTSTLRAATVPAPSQSSWLRDALSELDPSTKTLTIIGNPPPPQGRAARHAPLRLRLRAVGQYGSTEMDYPNDREVLESCECPVPVSFS